MFFSGSSDTHLLTGSALELKARPHHARRLLWGGLLLATVLVLMVVFQSSMFAYFDTARQVMVLEKEKKVLTDTVAQRSLELEMEQATREELEKQVASLNEQLNKMKTELSFFKSQQAR